MRFPGMTDLRRGAFAVVVGMASVVALAPAASAEFDKEALIEGAKKEGKLVWYTGAPQALATAMLNAFHEKYPFIDVSEYFRQSAGRLQARLMAEVDAGKTVADVLHSGDITQFVELEDLFATFESPEQAHYADSFKKPGVWTAWRMTTLDFAYNPSVLSEEDAPKSWVDLTDPKYKGKIGLQDSTAGLMFLEWFLLKEALGDDFWPKIGENDPVIFSGSVPIVDSMLRGEIAINGNAPSYLNWQYSIRDGAPYKPVTPTEGVPVALNPIAVMKDAPHPNAARLFVDWILSKEGQEIMVSQIGDYSPRDDVDPIEGMTPIGDMKVLAPTSIEALAEAKSDFAAQWDKFKQ